MTELPRLTVPIEAVIDEIADTLRTLHLPWTITGEPYWGAGTSTWKTCATCGGRTYPCATIATLEEIQEETPRHEPEETGP